MTDTLPSNLTISQSPAATNGCGGSSATTSSAVSLAGATLPASGSCTIVLTVSSSTAGTYTDTIAAGAISTTPAAANTTAAATTLTVSASGSSGVGMTWVDLLLAAGFLGARPLLARQRSHAADAL